MDYLLVVQAPARRTGPTTFTIESAFAEHLYELRTSAAKKFDRLILFSPSARPLKKLENNQSEIDELANDIFFVEAYPSEAGTLTFWAFHATSILFRSAKLLSRAGFVHSGVSTNMKQPFLLLVNTAASWKRKPLLFVVDIDFREHSFQSFKIGRWSYSKYFLAKQTIDRFKDLQVRRAIKNGHLVLLKGASMVLDYGKGLFNVKNFYDVVHSERQVISEADENDRLEYLGRPGPLLVCYFGRLVWNKGIDHIIRSIKIARDAGVDVRLTVLGGGDIEHDLKKLVDSLGLNDIVWFRSARRYGNELFEALAEFHLMIAAPLIEDTPRAAFDAMARGLPILAYDIAYFRDLAGVSGAISLAKWPEPSALANSLANLAVDRTKLQSFSKSGLAFARENTQKAWLKRRAEWTFEHAKI